MFFFLKSSVRSQLSAVGGFPPVTVWFSGEFGDVTGRGLPEMWSAWEASLLIYSA